MEKRAKNVETAKAICLAIGGEFSAPHAESEAYFYCTMPDGVRFSIRLGGWAFKGRVSFGPAYPKYVSDENGGTRQCIQRDFDLGLRYSESGFDGITVSDTKTPEQMAKDIRRRFLPTYVDLWPKAVSYCDEQAAYWSARGDAKQQIENALRFNSGYRISHFSRDSASIELYAVTPEMAKKIAEILPKR